MCVRSVLFGGVGSCLSAEYVISIVWLFVDQWRFIFKSKTLLSHLPRKRESCAYIALSTFCRGFYLQSVIVAASWYMPSWYCLQLVVSVCVGMQNTGCPCTMCLSTCGPYHHTDQALTSCVKRYTTRIIILIVKCSTRRPMGKVLFLISVHLIHNYHYFFHPPTPHTNTGGPLPRVTEHTHLPEIPQHDHQRCHSTAGRGARGVVASQ